MHISNFFRTFAAESCKELKNESTKEDIMQAMVQQPVMQNAGTISEEKWNSLHTLDELDQALKSIIHNHFHA